MKKINFQILIVAILVLVTALLRVVNAEFHIYNLVPIAALGLFSGSILKNKRIAYLIPLFSMMLSDIGLALFTSVQGFYGVSQFVTYFALALVTFLGTFLQKRSILNIAGFTISGSILFFILSNFGTFLSGYYGYSLPGLIECYSMAIPFYKSELANAFFINSLAGDLCFSFIAFGLMHLAAQKSLKVQTA